MGDPLHSVRLELTSKPLLSFEGAVAAITSVVAALEIAVLTIIMQTGGDALMHFGTPTQKASIVLMTAVGMGLTALLWPMMMAAWARWHDDCRILIEGDGDEIVITWDGGFKQRHHTVDVQQIEAVRTQPGPALLIVLPGRVLRLRATDLDDRAVERLQHDLSQWVEAHRDHRTEAPPASLQGLRKGRSTES